jgi:hypothetical protein
MRLEWLARSRINERILLYLFWEPSNRQNFSIFEEHQTEIMRFADAVRGAEPTFMAMPYSELWQAWERRALPILLSSHVARLRSRYSAEIKT